MDSPTRHRLLTRGCDRPKDWLDIEQMVVCADELHAQHASIVLVPAANVHDRRL